MIVGDQHRSLEVALSVWPHAFESSARSWVFVTIAPLWLAANLPAHPQLAILYLTS
jgi:hypothetical protein